MSLCKGRQAERIMMQIWQKIIVGMFVGIFVGWLFGENSPIEFFNGEKGAMFIGFINIIGNIFLKLLKMIVVPLIFFSLCIGVASMEDVKEVGSSGIKIMIYFMFTTAIAITIGVLLAVVLKPGSFIPPERKATLIEANQKNVEKYKKAAMEQQGAKQGDEPQTGVMASVKKGLALVQKNLLELIPENPIDAMAESRILQIIVFALFFGIGITNLKGDHKRVILRFCSICNEIMVYLVEMIMGIAPYGVCTLMAASVSKLGLDVISSLIIYSLVVVGGLLLHLSIVYMPVASFSSGKSPITILKGIKEALILAFSTSSSSATLPVTMRCVEENLEVPNKTTSFVLPLGATINMDGTALYQGVAAVFIAQVFGVDLSLGDMISIVVMATLSSIGAAGVPGAGMITLVMVLDTVNPALVGGVALVMGVDRLLDMVRTAINVTGDSTACLFMHYLQTKEEERNEAARG